MEKENEMSLAKKPEQTKKGWFSFGSKKKKEEQDVGLDEKEEGRDDADLEGSDERVEFDQKDMMMSGRNSALSLERPGSQNSGNNPPLKSISDKAEFKELSDEIDDAPISEEESREDFEEEEKVANNDSSNESFENLEGKVRQDEVAKRDPASSDLEVDRIDLDSEGNRTFDDVEENKQLQAKRMYVIEEEDEEYFSDKSFLTSSKGGAGGQKRGSYPIEQQLEEVKEEYETRQEEADKTDTAIPQQ